MKRLPDGSYLFGKRKPVKPWLAKTAWLLLFMVSLAAPLFLKGDPFLTAMLGISVLFHIGEGIFESLRSKPAMAEPSEEFLSTLSGELTKLKVRNMIVRVTGSDNYSNAHSRYGVLDIPSQHADNWTDGAMRWSVRRAVISNRLLNLILFLCSVASLSFSLTIAALKPPYWNQWVIPITVMFAMFLVLAFAIIWIELRLDAITTKGASSEDTQEYFSFMAHTAANSQDSEELLKSLRKRATRLGIQLSLPHA